MKVVLFCGGRGTRLNGPGGEVPKPMLSIGYRPILWHIMKYYAHFGHNDFILCLGYRADAIKEYFLHYNEAVSNDFVMSGGGKHVQLVSSDIQDWTIRFVDTGPQASIGERLKAVEAYLAGEDYFLANYSDGLTNLDLNQYIEEVRVQDKVLSLLSVRPALTMHAVSADEQGLVRAVMPVGETDLRINGGYFICRQDLFGYLGKGEDLVGPVFTRLIADRQLLAHRYSGFWKPMDTFRDRQELEELWAGGQAPWEVWKCA
ncbi:MAG: glucose-1-phosphate cytidylyltransferase [Actinobacteria bacterium RBG_16_64_13]|nr:MAG: glucose-1-phosphate cytidylyltransferase [Actinobacteria bacterium RBG_16_64_13]